MNLTEKIMLRFLYSLNLKLKYERHPNNLTGSRATQPTKNNLKIKLRGNYKINISKFLTHFLPNKNLKLNYIKIILFKLVNFLKNN